MEETQNHHFLRPLHPPTTAYSDGYTTGTTPESRNDFNNFSFRLVFIACIALVSVWATYEASKGFSITIINEAAGDTFAGKRFHLFYVSNDQAIRLILERSEFAENTLYPPSDHHPKKTINHVTLRLSSRNLSRPATTVSGERDSEFVIHLSPSIMHEKNFKHSMFLAVQRGMARIWLWDGQGNAPVTLINGVVDYISSLAVNGGAPAAAAAGAELPEYSGSGCWKGTSDPRTVAGFLNYCEGKREGFVRRLNQEMKNNWHENMVDDALGGMPAKTLCNSYHSSRRFSTSSI
ncbi:PREDICTED: uncharacterized protein LOC109150370 [Ipomoea nil]|uniref:uncharacterized protein LOC109150370 n=1 Tax=Ipomoea nil TaxID=35883 RepID=UPI000900A8F9|nr:PREDICTED: uncharacterized protein LOC109150370 [Ipomoea nil]